MVYHVEAGDDSWDQKAQSQNPQSDDSLSLHRLLYRMQILNPQRSENFYF
jgi:hypothetical protein